MIKFETVEKVMEELDENHVFSDVDWFLISVNGKVGTMFRKGQMQPYRKMWEAVAPLCHKEKK